MKNISRVFKTMFLLVVVMMGFKSSQCAQSVHLVWAASQDSSITQYGIYRSTSSDTSFALLDVVNHPDSIYIDDTVSSNNDYAYAVTSFDQDGNESAFSNKVNIIVTST